MLRSQPIREATGNTLELLLVAVEDFLTKKEVKDT